jgi:mycofactocin precursor
MTIQSLFLAIACLGLRHPGRKNLYSIAASLKVMEDITLMEDKEKTEKNLEKENQTDDAFTFKEIIVEEISVDGICGVY